MAFDIGKFLGNLLLAYFAADGHASPAEPRCASYKLVIETNPTAVYVGQWYVNLLR